MPSVILGVCVYQSQYITPPVSGDVLTKLLNGAVGTLLGSIEQYHKQRYLLRLAAGVDVTVT